MVMTTSASGEKGIGADARPEPACGTRSTGNAVPTQPTARTRVAFCYRVRGDVRFISHHDSMRMFQRALARAGLPLRFSAGFNPHPRISIPVPRPVGVASEAEVMVAEFADAVDADVALERLQAQMPEGVSLYAARLLGPQERPAPEAVRYRWTPESIDADALAVRVRQFLSSDVVTVSRITDKSGAARPLDVRPLVEHMEVRDGALEFVVRVTPTGTARPAEIIAALGLDAESVMHQFCRLEIRWTSTSQLSSP